MEPVIEVALNGSKPLLALGSAVNLKLSGVTILVRYPKQAAVTPSAPPAVIMTASSSKIDRCAFKVAPGPKPRGSIAVQSDIGNALEVDRCWFEGFDTAIEISADHRTGVRISETMIVRAPVRGRDEVQPGEGYGWGVKLRFTGAALPLGKKALQPNCSFDHCTFEGAGLVDLTNSSGPGPVEVEVKQCVVRANTLLAVNPKRPPRGADPLAR